MLALQEIIDQKFSEIPAISNQMQYFNTGVDKKSFPTVIVNFPSENDNDIREDIYIDIDIWYDNNPNAIIQAEGIIDSIDEKLRKLSTTIDNKHFLIDRLNVWKLTFPDIESDIMRTQLKYTSKVYTSNL